MRERKAARTAIIYKSQRGKKELQVRKVLVENHELAKGNDNISCTIGVLDDFVVAFYSTYSTFMCYCM